jgi:hypothetical protein
MVTDRVADQNGSFLYKDRLIQQIDDSVKAKLEISQLFVMVHRKEGETAPVGETYIESVPFMVKDADKIKALLKAPA